MGRSTSGSPPPVVSSSAPPPCIRWCATNWAPNAKCRGPVTHKNPDTVAAFCRDAAQRLQAVVSAHPSRPIKVWAFDESRFGFQTIRRRRITARGVKPVGRDHHRFENFYLYGSVAPACGDGFFLGLPKLNQDHVQRFLDEFARARPDTLNVLLLDNARSPTAKTLRVPENVILLFQPPSAPEVNPVDASGRLSSRSWPGNASRRLPRGKSASSSSFTPMMLPRFIRSRRIRT
jgi:hypothetical protein